MKKKILFFLEKANGAHVSGELMARELGVSRMAVSKAVAQLKKEGAKIESSTGCGYRLTHSPDILYPEAVQAHLHSERTLDIYCHRCIGSTNEEAKKLAAAGAAHGTLVIAEEQSAGRGRYGRSFFSPADSGIYMSMVIRPTALKDDVMYTVAAAVAVRRVISKYNDRARIKWVNDIYIDEKKVCGILCEAVSELESGTLGSVICGIGINLTHPKADFPTDIKNKASAVSSSEISRAKIAAEIADSVLDVLGSDNDALIREYQQYMMLCGRKIRYSQNGTQLSALVLGVDERGGLIVEGDGGETHVLRSGEVNLEKF